MDSRKKSPFCVGLLLVAFGLSAYAENPPCQTELNGYLLGQEKSTLKPLGKPFQTGDHKGWAYQAYRFGDSAYLTFEFSEENPTQISAIQADGEIPGMPAFAGIKSGENRDTLLAKFGAPETTTDESDDDLTLFSYKDRNYSFEIDRKNELSSIRIVLRSCGEPTGAPNIEELKNAILHHDIEGLLGVLSGNLEIYKSGKVIFFTAAARKELGDANAPVTRMLFGSNQSLETLFKTEKAEADQEVRIYEKAPPGSVAKFPTSKLVKEIVYAFEAGKWRVWEIRFR